MTPRIRVGFVLGVMAAAGAAALAASSRIWLRILIAPAWITGALAAGSVQSPSMTVVLATTFIIGFAIGVLVSTTWTSVDPNRAEPAKLLAANLVALYTVVAAELALFPKLAGALFEAVGGDGAVGGEFPVVFALRLLPGALAFLVLATLFGYLALRRWRRRMGFALSLIWLSEVALLLASVAWYFSPAGTRPPGV